MRSASVTFKSCTEANTRLSQIVLYIHGCEERMGAQRGTKITQ